METAVLTKRLIAEIFYMFSTPVKCRFIKVMKYYIVYIISCIVKSVCLILICYYHVCMHACVCVYR